MFLHIKRHEAIIVPDELLCEYTCSYDENYNITGTYNDGSLQIIGVKNE